MTFSPDLDDAVSRVRFGVGDIATPELFGDAVYEAALLAHGNNEPAAITHVAAALAAYYSTQPTHVSSNGSSVSWGARIAQWNAIASGKAGGPAAGRAFSRAAVRADGYAIPDTHAEFG